MFKILPHLTWSCQELGFVATLQAGAPPIEVETLGVLTNMYSLHNLFQANNILNEINGCWI